MVGIKNDNSPELFSSWIICSRQNQSYDRAFTCILQNINNDFSHYMFEIDIFQQYLYLIQLQ